MIRIITVLVGLGIAGIGLSALVLSFFTPMDTTVEWYKTVAECIICGSIVSVIGIYGNRLLDLVKKIKLPKKEVTINPTVESKKEEIKMDETKKDTAWDVLIKNYENLAQIAKGLTKQEDKDACSALQKRLLEIHHENATKPDTK